MKGISFTAIDFETANSSRLSACSIGLCIVENAEIIKKTSYLIKPPEHVGNFEYMQTTIHGLTYKDIKDAGEFCDIWDEIEPMLKNRVAVAHNMSFDKSVLKKLTEYYSLPEVPCDYVCTLKLAKRAFPMLGSFRLDSVCSSLGFPMNGNHHQAGADAEAAAKILIYFAKSRGLKNIKEVSEYTGRDISSLTGTVFTNTDSDMFEEESRYSEILEKVQKEIREVSNYFIEKLIEQRIEFGEENSKPTVKQLHFMVKLRNETKKPIFRTDIATRKMASGWISNAIEEKNRQNSYSYDHC